MVKFRGYYSVPSQAQLKYEQNQALLKHFQSLCQTATFPIPAVKRTYSKDLDIKKASSVHQADSNPSDHVSIASASLFEPSRPRWLIPSEH